MFELPRGLHAVIMICLVVSLSAETLAQNLSVDDIRQAIAAWTAIAFGFLTFAFSLVAILKIFRKR